ncbi:MAG TPA: 30S ribosomal protein S16 [Planctomycetota bacterium]|nr:30S ribosomal protein S16 [Planctomycetota bacterium]
MPVRIRLSRFGRLHRPYFRIVACDGRVHREGKAQEVIGLYDPLRKDKNIEVDMAKVEAWVGRGAQISEGLRNLLKFHGYQLPAAKVEAKPAKAAKKADKPKATAKGTYVAPTRRALRAHQAKLKGVRKAADEKAKAEKAAAAPAAPAEGAEQPKA